MTMPDGEPERRLMAAVIEQARKDLTTYNNGGGKPTELHDKVVAWIGTEDFRMVCDLAGLEHEPIEKALREEAERAVKECLWLRRIKRRTARGRCSRP